jgi:hypothetical protein
MVTRLSPDRQHAVIAREYRGTAQPGGVHLMNTLVQITHN